MERYLVTGGAGFIGSHIVEALVARGETVRVVDDLSTGKPENLKGCQGVELIEADLADPGVAERAVEDATHVLHIAAIPSVPRSVEEPERTHRANVDATLRLLLAARAAEVRRVVFASSSSVYGDSPTLPKHEGMTPHPRSPYALQKLVGEHYMRLFCELYGLETISLRFFNVFGPRQAPGSAYSGVISLFTSALSDGRIPTIHGDGEQTRDFTYVSDVAEGVLKASATPRVVGQAVNLAGGGRTSLNRLFGILRDLIGAEVQPRHGPPRDGDVRDSQADPSQARALLDFRPSVGLEDGLGRTVEWYRSQTLRDVVEKG